MLALLAPRGRRRFLARVSDLSRTLRSNDFAQIVLCAALGGLIGAIVAVVHSAIELLHRQCFALHGDSLLSTGVGIDRVRVLIVPAVGGLVLGVVAILIRRYRSHDIVDPVEANALYGGGMSLLDSIRLATAAIWSNVAGASLGMEAGYAALARIERATSLLVIHSKHERLGHFHRLDSPSPVFAVDRISLVLGTTRNGADHGSRVLALLSLGGCSRLRRDFMGMQHPDNRVPAP